MNYAAPFFSVIIPVHNRETLVGKAIESVFGQTFTAFEIICINNGSTDRTKEVIEGFVKKDPRVRLLDQENKGRCAARNRGMNEAKGEWICFLDSDDFYHPNHLASFKEFIGRYREHRAFASTLIHHDPLSQKNRVNRLEADLDLGFFIDANPISIIQVCLHRQTFDHLRFEEKEDLPIAEDWLFLRELVSQTPILKFNRLTVEVREHAGRSMRSTPATEIARCNVRSSEIFLERYPQSPEVTGRILAHAYLLGAHLYLQGKDRKQAWQNLLKAAQFSISFRKRGFYTAIAKFIIP